MVHRKQRSRLHARVPQQSRAGHSIHVLFHSNLSPCLIQKSLRVGLTPYLKPCAALSSRRRVAYNRTCSRPARAGKGAFLHPDGIRRNSLTATSSSGKTALPFFQTLRCPLDLQNPWPFLLERTPALTGRSLAQLECGCCVRCVSPCVVQPCAPNHCAVCSSPVSSGVSGPKSRT